MRHFRIFCMYALFGLCTLGMTACGCKGTRDAAPSDASAPITAPAEATPTQQDSPDEALHKYKSAVADTLPLYKGVICTMPNKALYQLDKVLTKNPRNSYALALKALALSQIDQSEAAFNAITTAILYTPSPRLYGLRALIVSRTPRAQLAARDVEYALGYNPDDAVALMVRGELALRQGQLATGCADLTAACDKGECSGLEAAQVTQQCPK